MAENQKPQKLKNNLKSQDTQTDWENKIKEAKEKQEQSQMQEQPAQETAKTANPSLTNLENYSNINQSSQDPIQTETIVRESPKTEPEQPIAEEKEKPEEFESYFDPNVGSKSLPNQKYFPTDEEKSRRASYFANPDGDASTLVHELIGSSEDIEKASNIISEAREPGKRVTKEELDANPELKELFDWAGQMRAALEDSETFGNQKKLLMSMIDALNRHDIYLQKLDKRLSISKITSDLSGKPKVYKGKEAIQLINNRYRGVYKIQLPNSGFWIKVTPLTPANMDAWIHEVDYGYKQLGRLIGGHFYLGFGVYLKQKLADLLKPNLVVDSNLLNWSEGTTLVDNISIHDYDVLCWAFSTLIHRNGITISTTCTNPDCKFTSNEQYIDLARCMYVNPEVLTKEAIEFLIAGNAPGVIRTKEALYNYRTKLLKNRKFITFKDNDQLELADPSLGEYIRTGMKILGKLAASVKDGKLDVTEDEVQRQTAFQLSTMFSSWVKSIVLKDESNNVVAVIEDQDAISYQLETVMAEQNDFTKKMEEFITNSKASFCAYIGNQCPKCGKQPDLLKDNFDPLDMEYILFCLSYLKLDQIGQTL